MRKLLLLLRFLRTSMRFRGPNIAVSWSRFFCFAAFFVSSFALFNGFSYSTFRFLFGGEFQPVLSFSRKALTVNAAVSSDFPATQVLSIRETVLLPDQVILFLNYPPSAPFFTKEKLDCVYLGNTSAEPRLKLSPARVEADHPGEQIVRCPTAPRGLIVTVGSESSGVLSPGPTHRWDWLAYEALLDNDNTTVLFVKGLNLRPDRVSNASRFECVYGWDFTRLVRSEVLSIAQEIVRCRTPLSVFNSQQKDNSSVWVSVRIKGRGLLPSIARVRFFSDPGTDPAPTRKPHEVCVCTMARNQARFLKEWVMYHAEIGVQRWYIYDNNSDDDTDQVVESLSDAGYNVSRHIWPWVKTQEGGFSHCALRARDSCEWVGFIDVDEFFHLPSRLLLHDVIKNLTSNISIGEIRVSCYNFGPSGLKQMPQQGVTVGYTCRMTLPERHKSIIKPEALNSTLINIVHHFHLREDYKFIDVDRRMVVVNHYKYQVWEVFKEKFYRRVATYVADWKNDQNVGSKDRAPGLGTKPVEPDDWSSRFCEVTDTGLKDMVLQNFVDPENSFLPWQTGRWNCNQIQEPRPLEDRIVYLRERTVFPPLSFFLTEKRRWREKNQKFPQKILSSQTVPVIVKMSMIFSVPNSNPRQPWLNGMRKLSSIIIASLLVEDPPDWQQSKHKKRSGSPCSTSRRKRRVQRRSIVSTPIAPLNLEEEEDQQQISKQENEKESMKEKTGVEDEKKAKVNEPASLHCLDKLREELSCAICLEICYEPSTTPCGHSFCKKCLRSAADKCGKRCPKCRQLISNGRSCTVNTVLWNTIQLLFPKEVEARKAAGREIEESGSRSSRRTRTRTRARVALAATETRMTVGGLGVSFRFTVGVRFRSGSYSSSSLSMVDVSPSCREKVIDSYDLLSAFSHHCFHPYAQQKLQLAADFVRLDSSLLVGLPFL